MKKTILSLTAFIWMTGAILTSCNTPSQKVQKAEDNVVEANQDLDKANKEYLADMAQYRKETAAKIAANNKSIADFNSRIENKKRVAKADYKREIAELEQKNSDMKKKLDDYKEEGKEKWEKFKADFSRDMDELSKGFNSTFNIK